MPATRRRRTRGRTAARAASRRGADRTGSASVIRRRPIRVSTSVMRRLWCLPARSRRIMHRLWIGFVAVRRRLARARRRPRARRRRDRRRRRSSCSCRCSPSPCSGAAAARGWGHDATRCCSPRSRCRGSATAPAPSSRWRPTVPMMLLFFGLAHLCYIWLFWRVLAVRRVPAVGGRLRACGGSLLLAVLWPNLGGAPRSPVALYGLVLGGTAVAASRCHPLDRVRAARSSSPPTRSSRSASSCPTRCPTGRARSSCSPTASARDSSPPASSSPTGFAGGRAAARAGGVTPHDGWLGPRRRVALGGPRLQDPLRRDDCMPRGACTGQRRPREGRAAGAAGRRAARAHRRIRPDPRREAADLQARRRRARRPRPSKTRPLPRRRAS